MPDYYDESMKSMILLLLKSHYDNKPDSFTCKLKLAYEEHFNLNLKTIKAYFITQYNEYSPYKIEDNTFVWQNISEYGSN